MSSVTNDAVVALCAVVFALILAVLARRRGKEKFAAAQAPVCHAAQRQPLLRASAPPCDSAPAAGCERGIAGTTGGPRLDEAILALRSRADALISAAGPVEARLDAYPLTNDTADAEKAAVVGNAARAARGIRAVAETLRTQIEVAADLQIAVGIYEGLRGDSGAVHRSIKVMIDTARRLRHDPPVTPYYTAASADLARFARAACDLTRAAHVLGAALGLE